MGKEYNGGKCGVDCNCIEVAGDFVKQYECLGIPKNLEFMKSFEKPKGIDNSDTVQGAAMSWNNKSFFHPTLQQFTEQIEREAEQEMYKLFDKGGHAESNNPHFELIFKQAYIKGRLKSFEENNNKG